MGISRGYTVIELMIVIVLIAIIGVTTVNLLFTSLNSSGKSAGLSVVKQNGDHAIGIIERQTRDAQSVLCPTPPGNVLTIVTQDDETISFQLVGSRIQMDDSVPGVTFLTSDSLVASLFTCAVTTFVSGQPDVVDISFRLELAGLGTDYVDEVFQTRVSLRTY